MPTCFIRGCKSSAFRNKQEGQEKRSLFRPTTDEILEQWRSAIPGGESLEKKHVVCDLHFLQEEVIKEYVEHCSAVTTPYLYMKPQKFRLKKGAVPSVFPNLEKESHESLHKKIETIMMKKCKTIDIPLRVPLDEKFLDFTDFKTIKEKCKMIPTPSTYWVVNNNDDTIVWNCWCKDYLDSSHKVVLHSDMSVRIFVKDREVNVEALKSVKNTNEIIKLLDEVSTFLPCFKKDVTRSVDCVGFTLEKDVKKKGPQIKICESCRKFQRKIIHKNNEKKLESKNIELQKKVKCLNQQRKRFIKKITRLKNKIEALKSQCAELEKKR